MPTEAQQGGDTYAFSCSLPAAQHPGLLTAQHQRQEAAFAAAASAASARSEEDGGPAGQGGPPEPSPEVERGGPGSTPAAAVAPEEEEQSPEALLLSCDEELPAEKEVQVALPGGLYGGPEDGGGENAAARLYALQEQTVLEEFASCLKKIISVGQKRSEWATGLAGTALGPAGCGLAARGGPEGCHTVDTILGRGTSPCYVVPPPICFAHS
jgi:hypothetical protein